MASIILPEYPRSRKIAFIAKFWDNMFDRWEIVEFSEWTLEWALYRAEQWRIRENDDYENRFELRAIERK